MIRRGKKKSKASVDERIQTVLGLWDADGRSGSVSAFCREAGISRANLYARRLDVIKRFRKARRKQVPRVTRMPKKSRSGTRPDAMARYKALLLVCMEQQEEIYRLREELASLLGARTKRRSSPSR